MQLYRCWLFVKKQVTEGRCRELQLPVCVCWDNLESFKHFTR